jgi:hypothetical protein
MTADREASAPAEPVVPLAKCIGRFWDGEDDLQDFQVKIQAPAVEAAPIKRLGVPHFWRNANADFIALFARAYGELTQASLEAALGKRETRE